MRRNKRCADCRQNKLTTQTGNRHIAKRGRIDPAHALDFRLRHKRTIGPYFIDLGLDDMAWLVGCRRTEAPDPMGAFLMHRATEFFMQFAGQCVQIIAVVRIALAARLLPYRGTAFAHHQHPALRIAYYRGNDADDLLVTHNRENDQDCMRPSLYGITPWNGRGS